MENDIRRNGSGYVDPTAHKAIKNMMREEHKREVNSEQRFNDFLTATLLFVIWQIFTLRNVLL